MEIQKSNIQEFARRKGMEIPDNFDVTSAFAKRANKRKELMRLRQTIFETNIPWVVSRNPPHGKSWGHSSAEKILITS
ncbi:hypothetical protein [Fredinandcohnia quinoae]|uniref:Uncharacterized protein n=1 Tax=Fredinandcohnia quinoae TaxID=2918902 RepID=A0AAW5DUB9_9BACI|nr:hypothetical protein [Fredinandcohnia sp. SECRCQ15]MCH1624227.1 hypothetical protein [Fredinandcohnia sp. SECRCQ15]